MNEFHRIVITTGISVFAPFNIYGKWARTLEIFDFPRSNPKPHLETDTEEMAIDKWKKACQETDFKEIDNPMQISAEFSLLHALKKRQRLHRNPEVVLIHTDTLGGEAAVHLLKQVLNCHFNAEVRPHSIADFDVNNPQRLRQSLGNFMHEVAIRLEGYALKSTCFAPVGGYKVMTSLGYLAGAYMGFPTAYLHEDGQMLHEIAAVPIQIKHEDLAKVAPLMRHTDNVPTYDSLSSSQQTQVDNYPYLFERLEDSIGLSPLSYFFMRRPEYRDLFAPKIKISSAVKKAIVVTQLRLDDKLAELLKKLSDIQANRNELEHEVAFDKLKGCTFSLYKCGARTPIFRSAYNWNQEANTLYVNRIWTQHDLYEREVSQSRPNRDIAGLFDKPESITWYDF